MQAILQYSTNPSTETFRYPMAADGLTITPITWSGDMICMKIQLHGCAYGEKKMKVYRPKNAISLLIISTCEKALQTHAKF